MEIRVAFPISCAIRVQPLWKQWTQWTVFQPICGLCGHNGCQAPKFSTTHK